MGSCILCGNPELIFLDRFGELGGVTSDCKPWPRAGRFAYCARCGHCQKEVNPQWLSDVQRIYEDYEMFPLGEGNESLVFSSSGQPSPRFVILLDKLIDSLKLPEHGALLDIGCGNGNLLQQFHRRKPDWKLFGHEQSARQDDFRDLQGVERVYSGDIGQIDRTFDLILMTHVIEHIADPVAELEKVRKLLAPGGMLLVQTVCFHENPFDLITCDHCSHFSPHTLRLLLEKSGFETIKSTQGWLAKEIGFVVRAGMVADNTTDMDGQLEIYERTLTLLRAFIDQSVNACTDRQAGIFGSANAGCWLAGILGDVVSFFVEEDANRWGQEHLGLPIVAPRDIPEGAVVLMPFPSKVARAIAERLSGELPGVQLVLP